MVLQQSEIPFQCYEIILKQFVISLQVHIYIYIYIYIYMNGCM